MKLTKMKMTQKEQLLAIKNSGVNVEEVKKGHYIQCGDCEDIYFPMLSGLGLSHICPHCNPVFSEIMDCIRKENSSYFNEIARLQAKLDKKRTKLNKVEKEFLFNKTELNVDFEKISSIINEFSELVADDNVIFVNFKQEEEQDICSHYQNVA